MTLDATGPITPAGLAAARAASPPVSGPHLVREVRPGLVDALTELWLTVSRAGGAVDFTERVAGSTVRAAAEALVAEIDTGRTELLAISAGRSVVGTVFLTPGVLAVVAHRATVGRLMVHPALRRRGWGGRLLDAAVAHARSMRLEQLLLCTRSGTGLPEYYAAHGWTEVGRFPRAIRLDTDDYRDEVWFQRLLQPRA